MKLVQAALVGMLLGALMAGAISKSANAILLSQDLNAPGDGLLTRDTDTSLLWLDLTQSTNRSFNDVAGQFGPGGDFEGFRHVTFDELFTFFTNAGIPDIGINAANETAGNFAPVVTLQNLVGITLTNASGAIRSIGIFDDALSGVVPNLLGEGQLSRTAGQVVANVEIFTDVINPAIPDDRFGHWLVRVPEPGTLSIFGLALIGLAIPKRKRTM